MVVKFPSCTKAGTLRVHDGQSPSPPTRKLVKFPGYTRFGTLRIHEAPSPPPMDDEDGTSPPPLDPPASPPGHLRHHSGGGDVVLIIDLPEVFLVGYDCVSFTAKHFAGIRDVPPGPHFFWLANPDAADVSTRSGFWIVGSQAGDAVHVVQWDKHMELAVQPIKALSKAKAEAVDDIHEKLVPYAQPETVGRDAAAASFDSAKASEAWSQIAESISSRLLQRLVGGEPHRGNPSWFVHTTDRVDGVAREAAEIELDQRISYYPLQRELRFSVRQIDRIFSLDRRGSDRTNDATDASPYIQQLMKSKELTHEDILGELQLAYIAGTYLGNDACIQQWWHMVEKLFLKAFALIAQETDLVSAFLGLLAAQIAHSKEWVEKGGSILDQTIHTRTRGLRLALTVYKIRLDEFLLSRGSRVTNAQLEAGAACHKVEAVVSKHLDWDMRGGYLRRGKVVLEDGEEVELELSDLQGEDERGEFAPEVVEIDDAGRQRDLVSWTD